MLATWHISMLHREPKARKSAPGGTQPVLEISATRLLSIQVRVLPGWPCHTYSVRPDDQVRGPVHCAARSVPVERDDDRIGSLLPLLAQQRYVQMQSIDPPSIHAGAQPGRLAAADHGHVHSAMKSSGRSLDVDQRPRQRR